MASIVIARGGGATPTFAMPASSWSAGGHLLFAAKSSIDDDATDSAAVLKGSWDDTAVTDVTIGGVAYKQYACHFPADTLDLINSNGSESLDFIGDFKWVPVSGDPLIFPATDPKLTVTIIFNVKVGDS